ncbi:MAG: hypothetical protein AAFR16_08500 [Pseudomonadota bacterium]
MADGVDDQDLARRVAAQHQKWRDRIKNDAPASQKADTVNQDLEARLARAEAALRSFERLTGESNE